MSTIRVIRSRVSRIDALLGFLLIASYFRRAETKTIPSSEPVSFNGADTVKQKATAAERRHLGRVAALGCICCSECLSIKETPAQVHHVRARHGWGRTSHFATIPLCSNHHQNGKDGVHDMGRDEFAERYGKSELELLDIVNHRLGVTENE